MKLRVISIHHNTERNGVTKLFHSKHFPTHLGLSENFNVYLEDFKLAAVS